MYITLEATSVAAACAAGAPTAPSPESARAAPVASRRELRARVAMLRPAVRAWVEVIWRDDAFTKVVMARR